MVGFLVAGLIIGALARLIKPGRQNLGILATLGLGLVGSLIGGTIAWLIGTGSIWELDFLGFVFAVVASVLLVGTAEAVDRQGQPEGDQPLIVRPSQRCWSAIHCSTSADVRGSEAERFR